MSYGVLHTTKISLLSGVLHRTYFLHAYGVLHAVKFTLGHGVLGTLIFLKDSIVQINYIGMEYSIGSNFIQDMEFSKYQIFEELHRAIFFSVGMEYSIRQDLSKPMEFLKSSTLLSPP